MPPFFDREHCCLLRPVVVKRGNSHHARNDRQNTATYTVLPGKPTRYAQSPERPYSPSSSFRPECTAHCRPEERVYASRIHTPRRQRRAKRCQFNSIVSVEH